MKIMTNFNDVKTGERFFYNGWEYMKTCCLWTGEIGAIDLHSGMLLTNCSKWMVKVPKQTKEKRTEQGSEIAIFTCDDDDPIIMRITKEQKKIIKILHDYNILCYDINVNFKSDTFVIDATKE